MLPKVRSLSFFPSLWGNDLDWIIWIASISSSPVFFNNCNIYTVNLGQPQNGYNKQHSWKHRCPFVSTAIHYFGSVPTAPFKVWKILHLWSNVMLRASWNKNRDNIKNDNGNNKQHYHDNIVCSLKKIFKFHM